jgi:hypothetical protein
MGACVVVSLLSLAGCGRPSDVLVEGTVTYDGQPVEEGAIGFMPTEAGTHSQGAVIKNGRFTAMVRPGKKRIEIRGSRPLKPDPGDQGLTPGREDFIPAKFNSATTLTADIRADGENRLSFDLRSK